MKIKVGIFFGGPSREREISFAGGRTVYDNLNKSVFEPVPIFVDSFRNFILLDWQYIYKGTIRDFYPSVDQLPETPNGFQIYVESLGPKAEIDQNTVISRIGKRIDPESLPNLINVAFLCLHGEYGEDGQIQRELEALQIPYTGSGVHASRIGMDKALQKELMAEKGFETPEVITIRRPQWPGRDPNQIFQEAIARIGFPIVIRPANQGSSIGVSIIGKEGGFEAFYSAVNSAFFRELIPVEEWKSRNEFERREAVRLLSDIRDGLGFPMDIEINEQKRTLFHPEELLAYLNDQSEQEANVGPLISA